MKIMLKEFKLKTNEKIKLSRGGVEAEVKLPEKDLKNLLDVTVQLCKRKGYIMTPVNPENFKLVKGQDLLTSISTTMVAEHYFCSQV